MGKNQVITPGFQITSVKSFQDFAPYSLMICFLQHVPEVYHICFHKDTWKSTAAFDFWDMQEKILFPKQTCLSDGTAAPIHDSAHPVLQHSKSTTQTNQFLHWKPGQENQVIIWAFSILSGSLPFKITFFFFRCAEYSCCSIRSFPDQVF